MSAFLDPRCLAAFLASALATLVLAGLARRIGWTDRPGLARKRQPRPVPPIGGLAILVGLAALALGDAGGAVAAERGALQLGAAGGVSLVLAFAVGLWDDLAPGGLAPRSKLLLQGLAALPWASDAASAAEGPARAAGVLLLHGLAAVAAMNAFNTFDNADGALGTLTTVGFAVVAPPLVAPLLGFLPFNLDVRAASGRRVSPTAYLGDAGSHLLGFLVLATPGAWPVLLLPAIDLARLALVRWRSGARPWHGDRRHLAHRLAAAGLGRLSVAATLAALATPSIVVHARLGAGLSWLGFLATALLFLWVVARTPDPLELEAR